MSLLCILVQNTWPSEIGTAIDNKFWLRQSQKGFSLKALWVASGRSLHTPLGFRSLSKGYVEIGGKGGEGGHAQSAATVSGSHVCFPSCERASD